MSNTKSDKIQYSTDFIKKELTTTNEITIKNEYDNNNYKERTNLNSDEHSLYHDDNDHSCYYNTSSSVPKTILITNNYSQDDQTIGLNNKNIKKSSITIVTHNSDSDHHTSSNMPTSASSSTVVLDRINICINNHFNDPRSSVKQSSLVAEKSYSQSSSQPSTISLDNPIINNNNNNNNTKDKSTEPDSTTNNVLLIRETSKQDQQVTGFTNGQDVLVQRKDGRFYLGTIVAISRNQFLVKFDDNTEYWSSFDELTKLSSNDTNNDPFCVVCKKINNNDIVEVCEQCGRGYHQKCTDCSFPKNGIWFCRRCTAPNGFKSKISELRGNDDRKFSLNGIGPVSNQIIHKSQLPYNIDSLTWDNHHRVNLEQIYCYCGGNGEWYNKMLQCCKCQQWYHEKCVGSLDYPVYCGDRFYVFVCTMCNYGKEFLRRLQMKWNDVVHLLLFNITINNQKKYYHANKVIVPYAIDNWPMLQLNQNMRNLSSAEIRDNIIETLSMNNARFKCGREIKKRQSVWGLRSRIPPPAPKLIIPFDMDISDQYLRQHTKLDFIPLRSLINIPDDIDAKLIGATYLGENSDNESSGGASDQKFTSDDELPIKLIVEKEKKARELPYNITNNDSMDVDEVIKVDTFDTKHIKKNRKRKSPFLSTLIVKNDLKTSEIIDICDSSDETSSRGTLDLIIPPPKNFQGRNNPFRLTPKKNDNNNIVKFDHIKKVAMKQTGLAPPLFGCTDLSQSAGQYRIVRTVKRRLSAKDIMIGPNKEIKRRRLRRRSGNVEVISTATIQTIPKSAAYLPIRSDTKEWPVSVIRSTLNSTSSSASSTPQATTPTNLGPITNVFNGRRLRQRQGKNYSEVAPRRNSNSSLTTNCSNIGTTINIPGSPNKSGNQSEVSLSELKTSVNMYFGAANLIANGENFAVRAKRFAPNGKLQYLIEWEGIS